MTGAVMDQSQSLADWLCYLEQIHPTTIDLGLSRVGVVADRLQLRKMPAPVVTVGGTNGKGTTCALLEAIYREAGLKVAVYSSPHLLRYNERVRIDGLDVSDEWLCRAFAEVEAAREGISLTFFEFGTLAALWIFAQQKPDLILLEVGLGGRLDATNLVQSDVAVITTIALDHCDWLGNTREAIASEKAGIMRPGKPAVSGEPDPPEALAHAAALLGANFYQVGSDFHREEGPDSWSFNGMGQHWSALPYPQLPLDNAVTALAVCALLPIELSIAAIRQGLVSARLAGRLQPLGEQPEVLVDVAHNPHSAAYLASQLAKRPVRGRTLALCGMLRDKDIEHTLEVMTPHVDEWFLADLQGPRAAMAAELQRFLPDVTSHCFDSVASAYGAVLAEANPEDVVVVFGSFYTVADVMALDLNKRI